ncbi:MAG: hypothetical protein ACRCYQ_05310, partial [Nocardioides sp.]
ALPLKSVSGGLMVDLRQVLILVTDRTTGQVTDKTPDVVRYRRLAGGKAEVVFSSRLAPYIYGPDRLQILDRPACFRPARDERIEVAGVVWESATEVVTPADIGITTPYRRQVDKVTDAFIDEIEAIEADTVHKYRGARSTR